MKRLRPYPLVALLMLAVAVALIVCGAAQGDVLDVLRKAALICFECIGIG